MSSINRPAAMQILNQKSKDTLVNRLKRDELMKQLFEKRMKICDLTILIDAEHIKISNLKIAMYEKFNDVNRLYIKARKNSVAIELEHKKMAEMKLNIIKQLIPLDNENLTRNFDLNREVKIGKLTDDMNYNTPSSWDENKERLTAERDRLQNEIKKGEVEVTAFESQGKMIMQKIAEYTAKKNQLENEAVEITEKALPLNDLISDEPEYHPVTFVRVAETDASNPEDVLKNMTQE